MSKKNQRYSENWKNSVITKINNVIELSESEKMHMQRSVLTTKEKKHAGMQINIDANDKNKNTEYIIKIEITAKKKKIYNDKR